MEIGHTIAPEPSRVSAMYARQTPSDRRAAGEPLAEKPVSVREDAYVPSEKNVKKAGYEKPAGAANAETISRLKAESERIYGSLKETVRQMLERQGLTFRDLEGMDAEALGRIEVDETTRTEAAALIGEGGELSPEAVSDRIVDFAKALSGEDKSKLSLLRQAIEDGFAEAEKAWGGELPEISQKTYERIMEKLDAWEKGDTEPVSTEMS